MSPLSAGIINSESQLDQIPTDSLELWYSFDSESDNIALDKSPNGNDGTVYGAQYTSQSNPYLSLDGIDDYISVPTSVDISSGSFTVSTDVRLNDQPGQQQIYLLGDLPPQIATFCQDGTVYFNYYDGDSRIAMETQSQIGAWVNYVYKYNHDTETATLYVDKSVSDSADGPADISFSGTDSRIGSHASVGRYANMDIDNTYIFDSALDQDAINSLQSRVS